MKKTIFISSITILSLLFILMSFKPNQKTVRIQTKKTRCAVCGMWFVAQAPATNNISVAYNGSTIRISWTNSIGDHYTVGGYSGTSFQINCIYDRDPQTPNYVDVPYNGAGNFRITAFCGVCGSETSSDVSNAVYIN